MFDLISFIVKFTSLQLYKLEYLIQAFIFYKFSTPKIFQHNNYDLYSVKI